MAHIPKSDIETLWDSSPHNWSGFAHALEQHRDRKDGISDSLVVAMITIAKQEEGSGTAFPSSADALYQELNRKLESESGVREKAARAD